MEQSTIFRICPSSSEHERIPPLQEYLKAFPSPQPQRAATMNRPHFHFYPIPFRIDEGDHSRCEGGKPPMLSRESDADCYTHARLDYHATVRELPSHERPRERLEHLGPQALSLAQLLAITLR